jgi:hypothetical protein
MFIYIALLQKYFAALSQDSDRNIMAPLKNGHHIYIAGGKDDGNIGTILKINNVDLGLVAGIFVLVSMKFKGACRVYHIPVLLTLLQQRILPVNTIMHLG